MTGAFHSLYAKNIISPCGIEAYERVKMSVPMEIVAFTIVALSILGFGLISGRVQKSVITPLCDKKSLIPGDQDEVEFGP